MKEEKAKAKKKGLVHGSMRHLLACALAFSAASCLINPSQTKAEKAPAKEESSFLEGNGAKRLASSLTSSLKQGLSLKANEFTLKADEKNVFSFPGASLSLRLDELSLHGLDLTLSSEVAYNEENGRSIDARLIDDELYFALSSLDSSLSDYEVKYKVSTASYTYGENGNSVDSITGGIYQYEYGRLDWIIEDILAILSAYGYDTKPQIASSKLSFDFSAISASLEKMSESDAESHYFVWKLPLGDNTYVIGLQGDDEYRLSSIDFPAKNSGASNKLPNGMELSLSLSLSSVDAELAAPSDASSYLTLDNSIDLWERIADYAGKLSFSLEASHIESGVKQEGLLLSHHEDAIPATATTIARAGVDEKLTLCLSGGADFSSKRLNELNADVSLIGAKQKRKIALAYIQGENDKRAFVNVNDILKVKTSKSTADAFISAFSTLLNDGSISNEYLSSLFSALNSISEAFENLRQSLIGKDIEEGHYEHLLASLKSLKASNNNIEAVFDFSSAGGAGTLTFLLSGSSLSLAELTFSSFSLGGFGIDGTLKIGSYEGSEDINEDDYDEMDHLPTLTEQVQNLCQHYSASASVKGYVLDRNTSAVGGGDSRFAAINGKTITEQGFSFEGDFAFNLQEKAAKASAIVLDRKEDYLNEHAISLQLDGEIGGSDETGEMLFSYDSSNDQHNNGISGYKELNYGNIDEPNTDTLYGKFSVASINDILSLATSLLDSDDPRFSKFTSAGDALATTLIAKLSQGQFAPLLSEKILTSLSKTGDRISAKIAKEVLGSEEDASLNLSFDSNGLSYIDFGLVTESKEIYVQLDISVPNKTLTKSDLQISALENQRSSMTDFSSLSTLLEYVLGSATLGEDENSVSTYHLNGKATLAIGIFDKDVNFDIYISLDGAEVKVIGFLNLPMIAGANASVLSFGGTRYCEFYYHTSGDDSDGTLFLHRVDNANTSGYRKEYYAKVKGSDFMANIKDWMLSYMLGMEDVIMKLINKSSSDKANSLHGEELVSSYSYSSSSGSPSWVIKSDLSSLSTVISSPLEMTLNGKEVSVGNTKEKTLCSASGSLALAEDVLKINFSAALSNVSSGSYVSVWNNPTSEDTVTLRYVSSKKVQTSQSHASASYEANYYKNGYVTSGNFASSSTYVTPPSL